MRNNIARQLIPESDSKLFEPRHAGPIFHGSIVLIVYIYPIKHIGATSWDTWVMTYFYSRIC